MTEGEFLKRFDEHLAFCRELLERNDAFVVQQRQVNEEYRAERRQAEAERRQTEAERRQTDAEHREAHAEQQQAMNDVRFELKQVSLRGERVAQGFIDVLRDLHAESVAGRQALFAMLDELKGAGPSAAGA